MTIAERFQQAGGPIRLEHRLKGFDQTTLPDGSTGIELHVVSGDAGLQTVRARKLILAMPRRSLELLDQTGAVLGPENRRVHELIRSVEPIPLFKLALCYSYAWWETLDPVPVKASDGTTTLAIVTRGQSVTDLPVRQCYYWAKNEQSQNAVVLIYDDGTDLNFWTGLRERHSNEAFEPDVVASGGNVPLPPWNEHKAPRLMVEEAHRQLLVMHGVRDRTDIPAPYAAAYRDWGEDPFGGGANFWRVRAKSNDVFRDILQPKPPVPVYVCGEAYSHDQGWVEGPLATADAMLERHFGLSRPVWLKS
jgi:monoamine oxidase